MAVLDRLPAQWQPWPNGVPIIAEMAMPETAKVKLLGENADRFLPRLAGVTVPTG